MPTTYYHTCNGRILGETTAGVRTDYLTDALGSVTATVNSSQAIVNTYRYKPYGEQLAKTGVGADPRFLWTGDTGSRTTLIAYAEQYNRARHYGSKQGQWTTRDPASVIFHPYAYADCNSTTLFDPAGLQSCGREPHKLTCKPVSDDPCGGAHIAECLSVRSKVIFYMKLFPNKQVASQQPYDSGNVGYVLIGVTYAIYHFGGVRGSYTEVVTKTEYIPNVTTSHGRLQYPGGWCQAALGKRRGGPFPPTAKIAPAYVYTKCDPGDVLHGQRVMLFGDEEFKFRIGTRTNNDPNWKIQGCRGGERNDFLFHPDGVNGDPWGTNGCITFRDSAGAHSFRSCMRWASEYGCNQIPLTVEYY